MKNKVGQVVAFGDVIQVFENYKKLIFAHLNISPNSFFI